MTVKVTTPTAEVIGEVVIETQYSIVIKTDVGRVSIDKGENVIIEPYTNVAEFPLATLMRISTVVGVCIYMKTKPDAWVLIWQERAGSNPSQVMSNLYLTHGEELTWEQFLAIVRT